MTVISSSNILDKRNLQSAGRHFFSGMVQNIDILDYIQFLMMSGITTILELRLRKGPTSRLYIDGGQILHAVSGELDGEEAFYRCIQSDGGIFTHIPWSEPGERTIEAPAEFLLLQAVRRRDERFSAASYDEPIPPPMAEELVELAV
jgi:hypothetical protein